MMFYSILVYWILISCKMQEKEIILPGKIAVQDIFSYECSIYLKTDSAPINFTLINNNEIKYSGLTWLNKEDNFLVSEAIPGQDYYDYRINIVKFDITGKLIDRIYEAEKGELAWVSYPSRKDEYLLFTTRKRKNPEIYPFEGLTPMLCLNIMDLNEKKIITKIDSIGRSPNFELCESPWLMDGEHFVYSLSDKTKIISEGEVYNSLGNEVPGVYKYSMKTGKSSLLVPDATTAVASRVKNEIAYVKDKKIYTLDLNNNSQKLIYGFPSSKNATDIHYTPDGKMIYIRFGGRDFTGYYSSTEKLIEISTGKEIKFKKFRNEYSSYSWK